MSEHPAHQRVALVTGSSRGLGSTIAARLALDGMAVAVNGVRGDGRALEVAGTIRAHGGIAEAFTAIEGTAPTTEVHGRDMPE